MIIVRGKKAIIELSSSSVKLLIGPAGKAKGLGDFTTDSVRTSTSSGMRGRTMDITWYVNNVLPEIEKYESLCDYGDVHNVVCYATGIYRLCDNLDEIFGRINESCGLEPILMSGQEEATLAPLGFNKTTSLPGWKLFIDQGRGSTEFTLQDAQGNIKDSASIYIGNEMLRSATNPQALVSSTLATNLSLKRILVKAKGLKEISVIGSGGILTKGHGFNHLDRISVSAMKQDSLLCMYVGVCSALGEDALVISKADSMTGAWFKYFG